MNTAAPTSSPTMNPWCIIASSAGSWNLYGLFVDTGDTYNGSPVYKNECDRVLFKVLPDSWWVGDFAGGGYYYEASNCVDPTCLTQNPTIDSVSEGLCSKVTCSQITIDGDNNPFDSTNTGCKGTFNYISDSQYEKDSGGYYWAFNEEHSQWRCSSLAAIANPCDCCADIWGISNVGDYVTGLIDGVDDFAIPIDFPKLTNVSYGTADFNCDGCSGPSCTTAAPTQPPSISPSISPTQPPSISPTQPPSISPSISPTQP
eukprot:208511_1